MRTNRSRAKKAVRIAGVITPGSTLVGLNNRSRQSSSELTDDRSLVFRQHEKSERHQRAINGGYMDKQDGTLRRGRHIWLAGVLAAAVMGVGLMVAPQLASARVASSVHVSAASSPVVIHTNSAAAPNGVLPPNGYLEICKQAWDYFVPAGPWTFTVTNSTGSVVDTEQVLVNQCNENMKGLPAGTYTVTETVSFPYHVSGIRAVPLSALVSKNVATATGTFVVKSGKTTTAFFVNRTRLGSVKVCKSLAANAQALSGQTFNFDVSDAAGTQTIPVVAQFGQTSCAIDYAWLPAGSKATVTEESSPNTAITGVAVIPPSAGTTTSSSATVKVSASEINAVVFTNQALGWVEVCKYADDASVTGSFHFTVNGAAINPVPVGQCSAPLQVPAGLATVNELQTNPNYHVDYIDAYGGSPPQYRVSSENGNSAVVEVPYGGIGNETVVDFYNSTLTGQFKICTAQTSPDAALVGDSFTYNYSYTVNGATSTGSVTLTVPLTGSACSGLSNYIPVINGNGTPVRVSVTAQYPTPLVGVDLAAFAYAGNGSVVSATPTPPTSLPWTAVVDLGTGINVDTFTNGATH
jgi:hypothetical protein